MKTSQRIITNSLLWQGILVTSDIWEPILGSDTPKLNLDFLPSFTLGKLVSKTVLSSSVNMPEHSKKNEQHTKN